MVLVQAEGGVRIRGQVGGLVRNGAHGLQVHETGDCSAVDARSAGRTIRLSLGRFTTEQDIDQAVQLIKSSLASAPAFWAV